MLVRQAKNVELPLYGCQSTPGNVKRTLGGQPVALAAERDLFTHCEEIRLRCGQRALGSLEILLTADLLFQELRLACGVDPRELKRRVGSQELGFRRADGDAFQSFPKLCCRRRGRADRQHAPDALKDRLHPLRVRFGQQMVLPSLDVAALGLTEPRTVDHGEKIGGLDVVTEVDRGLANDSPHAGCNTGHAGGVKLDFCGHTDRGRHPAALSRRCFDTGLADDAGIDKADEQRFDLTKRVVGAREQPRVRFQSHPTFGFARAGFRRTRPQRGPLLPHLRVADRALRLGQAVLGAPVAGLLELRDQ